MMRILFLLGILFSSFCVQAQDDGDYVNGDNSGDNSSSGFNSGFDWDKVVLGGGLGLNFGTQTFIDLSPTIGYYLTENILAGLGVNYTYFSNNNTNFSTSLYGARAYGQYVFTDLPILAHTELELLNVPTLSSTRINITNVYVGGGIKQPLGGSSYFYVLGLYNLNQTAQSASFQPNPIIRGGVAIGL